MKKTITYILAIICVSCSHKDDAKGVIYSGKADLNIRLRQFTAINAENEKRIILNMTGPHELTFTFNNIISHMNYEKDVIIFRSETNKVEWTAKKIRDGFELNDGTILRFRNCQDWTICLVDNANLPILKGKYSLNRSVAEISLWISDGESHVELLGFLANGLINRSRNVKLRTELEFETVLPQVWTY